MRKSLITVLLLGLPALAQVTGGHETVQDAIRFERQKDAAAARQARIEARGSRNATADRSADESKTANKASRAKKGSAARSNTGNSSEPKQQ